MGHRALRLPRERAAHLRRPAAVRRTAAGRVRGRALRVGDDGCRVARVDRTDHRERPLRRRALRRPPRAASTRTAADSPTPATTSRAGAAVAEHDPVVVPEARVSPFVRRLEELAGRRGDHDAVGQDRRSTSARTSSGRLRLRVTGPAGTEIVLRHAEVLEHGELGTRPLRHAAATDQLTLAGRRARVGARVHVPRLPLRRDLGMAGRVRPVGRHGRRDPQRHGAHRLVRDIRRAREQAPRERRLGPARATSSTCRPTARSATSDWAGPATSRCSRRPRASSTTCAGSSTRGCATSRSSRSTRTAIVPFVVPNVLGPARPAAAWGDAATVVPWVLNERYADSRRARAAVSEHEGLDRRAARHRGRPPAVGGQVPVRRLARPGRAAGPAGAGEDRRATSSRARTCSARPTRSREPRELLGNERTPRTYAAIAEEVRQAFLDEYVTPSGPHGLGRADRLRDGDRVRDRARTRQSRRSATAWPSSPASPATRSAPASSARRSSRTR